MKRYLFASLALVAAFALGGASMWAFQHPGALPSVKVDWGNTATKDNTLASRTPDPTQLINPAPTPSPGGSTSQGNVSPGMPMTQMPDPFQEMEQMRKQMDQMFGMNTPMDQFFNHGALGGGSFGGSFASTSVDMSEDADSVTYKLNVPKKDLVDLKVNVKDGYLSIDATMKQASSNSMAESQISQEFPVPSDVDPKSMKVDRGTESVSIHFDKLHA